MKRQIFRAIVILSITAAMFGCGKIGELEDSVQRLQMENAEMKKQVQDVVNRMSDILKRLESEIYPMGSSLTDHLMRIERIESELAINTEKADQNSYKISQMLQQIEDINFRLKTGSGAISSNQPAATGSYPSNFSRQYNTLSPNQLYQTAYADYLKGNYNLAIDGFKEYVQRYPTSELTGTVQYWLGESYYAKANYKEAIAEFDKVIVNFPNDEKVKSAALKKGFALFELNQTAQGVIIMQQIIREFPNSKQARIAQEKLESLGLKP
jgi:tol-pal system protein YbgF